MIQHLISMLEKVCEPLHSDPPINCGPPLFVETQAVVNRLKWGKASGICGIHDELLKAGGNAALLSLHVVLCSVWNTGIIPTDWKKGLVVFSGKEEVIVRTAITTEGDAALSARQGLCLDYNS